VRADLRGVPVDPAEQDPRGQRPDRQVLALIKRLRSRGLPVILISHNMPQVVEVADRIHIQRLGRCAGVITPQSHTMEEAVAIMTGATTLDGAAEDASSAAARDGGDRTESTGTAAS